MTDASRMLLHWSPRSPFVRKVMIAARELQLHDRIDLRRTVVSMATPNAALIPDNPLSKIPTLVLPDGQVIMDSSVICEYFDSLAGGGKLVPVDGAERFRELSRSALYDGWLELVLLWRNEKIKPTASQTAAWLESFRLRNDAVLDRAAKDLPALGSGVLKLSGIILGCTLDHLDFRFPELEWRDGRPALVAWHNEFRARPSAVATEITDDS